MKLNFNAQNIFIQNDNIIEIYPLIKKDSKLLNLKNQDFNNDN